MTPDAHWQLFFKVVHRLPPEFFREKSTDCSCLRAQPVSECDNPRNEGWSICELGVQGIYPLPAGGDAFGF